MSNEFRADWGMSATEIGIRRMHPSELEVVDRLVYFVVDEVYDGWMNPSPMPLEPGDWLPSWVAVADEKIIGMMMTGGEWLDDLWVVKGFRGMGLGVRLLEIAEGEIRGRGIAVARLRVIQTNVRAVGFYERHGWVVEKVEPHPRFPVAQMRKLMDGKISEAGG